MHSLPLMIQIFNSSSSSCASAGLPPVLLADTILPAMRGLCLLRILYHFLETSLVRTCPCCSEIYLDISSQTLFLSSIVNVELKAPNKLDLSASSKSTSAIISSWEKALERVFTFSLAIIFLLCNLRRGMSQTNVFCSFYVNLRTLKRWWALSKKSKSLKNKPGSDWKPAFSRSCKIIIAQFLSKRHKSTRKLANMYENNMYQQLMVISILFLGKSQIHGVARILMLHSGMNRP